MHQFGPGHIPAAHVYLCWDETHRPSPLPRPGSERWAQPQTPEPGQGESHSPNSNLEETGSWTASPRATLGLGVMLSSPNPCFSFGAEQGSLHREGQMPRSTGGPSEPRPRPLHGPKGEQRSTSDPPLVWTETQLLEKGSALVMLHILHCN